MFYRINKQNKEKEVRQEPLRQERRESEMIFASLFLLVFSDLAKNEVDENCRKNAEKESILEQCRKNVEM